MKKLTTKEFVERALKKHPDGQYDYSEVVYEKNNIPVEIRCTRCNKSFFQTPNNHLLGYGCPHCSKERGAANRTKNTEWFIEEARKIHGNRFDYSQSVYTKTREKLIIICPLHGAFQQTPNAHLTGSCCPKCRRRSDRKEDSR